MKQFDRLSSLLNPSCIVLLLILLSSSAEIYAQEGVVRQKRYTDHPHVPTGEPIKTIYHFAEPFDDDSFPFSIATIDEHSPQWAIMLYSERPNIWEMKELYDIWRKTNPTIKNGHTRNFRKLYTYLIEHRAVDEEGRIDVDTDQEIRSVQAKVLIDRHKFAQKKSHNTKASDNNIQWQLMGPLRMEHNSGEYANVHINVYALDQSLSDPNTLYCATESGGTIFKTTDKGDNWFSVSDSLIENMGPRELAIAPTNPDVVYLGVKYRVYKTEDGGAHWTVVYDPSTTVQPNSIIVHPSVEDTVLIGTLDGIIKTTDGGKTWTTVLPMDYIYDLRYNPQDPSIVYALVDNQSTKQTDFYRSTDGGDTWIVSSSGWPNEISVSNRGGRMTTSDGHPNIIFAFIGAQWEGTTGKEGIKVMKSSDSGLTWTTVVNYDDSGGINSGQGFYDWDIEMSDVDSNLVFLGTQGKWVTTDGFESKIYNVDIPSLGHADVQKALFNGSDLWVANDGGIIKFDDETFQSYNAKSNGINAISFWSFDQGWNRDAQVGTHYHNGTSVRTDSYNPGAFITQGGAEPSFSLLAAPNAESMVSKGYGSVNGKTIPDNQSDPVTSFNYNIVPNQSGYDGTSMTTMPRAYHTNFVALEDSVMRSDDFGKTWYSVAGFTYEDEYVRGISLSRANDSILYVITDHSSGGKLYKSDNIGNTFIEILQPSDFNLREAEISISNEDADLIYLAGKSRTSGSTIKIATSSDGGDTWTDLWTNTLSGYSFRKILHIDGTDGGIYLLTSRAVFYRNNTMSDWEALLDGLPPNATLQYMKPFYKESKIRIAGSRGVFGASLYDTPSMSDVLLQPTAPTNVYDCAKDTVYFDDYSVLDHNGANWTWSFSGAEYVSQANVRNPKVVYGQSGSYDVTISVDKDGETYSKTVSNMIQVNGACDEVDKIAGQAVQFDNETQSHIYTDDFNLITNTLTITAWLKPDSIQTGFTGIVTNGRWCAHCNDQTMGMIWNYWGNHLYYRWPNSTSGWAGRSDLILPIDEWSYVAMVMSPDSVIMYVNDDKWVQQITHEPADISNLYIGKGHYNKYFKGLIDEVAIWNRSLSDKEIRELKHLTKDPNADPYLIAYYQFNEAEGLAINKSGNYHSSLINGASRVAATEPIGYGVSNTQIEIDGEIDYTDTGVKINYTDHSSATTVVSRIDVSPYDTPTDLSRVFDDQYWVIHKYDAGVFEGDITFTISESLSLSDRTDPVHIVLYSRRAHSDDPWVLIDSAEVVDPALREITFDSISNYNQFLIAADTDGTDTDCISDVYIERGIDIPEIIGSSNFIETGDLRGLGEVLIEGGGDYLFKAKDYILFVGEVEVRNGTEIRVVMEDCNVGG